MMTVSLQPLPNQTLQAQLGGQPCVLNVYQYAFGLFMDVYVGNTPIVTGRICENLNRIVRSLYLGLEGDFVFYDTQGTSDPIYTGLGIRYQLIYLEVSDLPAGEG
jgi:hypothetical protein